jgi:hypothetical protein
VAGQGGEWDIGTGGYEGEALLPWVAPIFLTMHLRWQPVLIEEDEAVVGNYVYLGISPLMKLTNQVCQSLHLSVHMSDERVGAPMPKVVHLLVPKYHEQLAEVWRVRCHVL